MTAPHEPDRVDLLRTLLDGCFKVGVRHPADLASYPEARPMLDMLSPPHPGLSEHRRALAAHRMILTAVQALGSPRGDAAAALLGLVPGRSGTAATRTARRDEAAAHYGGISADWFQRRHEAGVTLALAMELDQQLRGQEGTTRTDPQRRSRAMTPPPPAASFQPRPTPTKTPTGQP